MADRRGVVYAAQQRTASVLWELLSVAADAAGLPPLAWTVSTTGALVAHVLDGTDATRRTSFQAWARFLAAQPIPDADEYGQRALRARAVDVYGCEVTVIAHLDEPVKRGER